MKSAFLLIFSICNVILSFAQNEDWESKDEILIGSVVQSLNSPNNLFELFEKHEQLKSPISLGFGYVNKNYVIYGGYISIWCDFIFYKDSLVSFILKPQLPYNPTNKQLNKYLNWYNNEFQITKDTLIRPKYYNYDTFKEPLKYYKGSLSEDDEIQFYMSTESGLIYGEQDEKSHCALENWVYYQKIEHKINKEIAILLMYSKNPISRLRAVEYYYNHREKFIKEKDELEKWIFFLTVNPAIIWDIVGCIMDYQLSETIIKRLSE
ncbi:hypothetical protein M0G43_12910 [Subsaxibacter sp. CAU 1640]|uniref:hypothetical protein n=1 Tax=Subsaxibacter sp. CAU 1640 TaxID=2933271 RepID=UPI00200627E1|nr:hypothetical protein [Subsaxibacter sp. CAU 1640]MCK7591480.1 hypothetical protein [Subsaxibacter sp. CAU 1640]